MHDHVGAVVVGRLDDVLDLLLRLFRLGERERAAAAGDLLFVLGDGLAAHGLDQLVQVHRVLEGLAGDAERAVGLAADVAGDLDAVQRFHHRLAEFLVAEVLDQHLDHVADLGPGLVLQARFLQRFVGVGQQLARCIELSLVSRAPSQQAAQVATMSWPGQVLVGQREVARRRARGAAVRSIRRS